MFGTMNCTYETPCGWCTKWDKKCDRKIPDQVGKPRLNSLDYAIRTATRKKKCYQCTNDGWDIPECKDCYPENDFKYFQAKEN